MESKGRSSMSLDKIIRAIVEDLPGVDIGVLIVIDKDHCLSMVSAIEGDSISTEGLELLSRLSRALWPNGGGGTVNKLPI